MADLKRLILNFRIQLKKLSVSFRWKALYLTNQSGKEKLVKFIIRPGETIEGNPDFIASIDKDKMQNTDTCYVGFYADQWNIR